MLSSPSQEYASRLALRRDRLAALAATDERFSYARLAVFAVAVVVLVAAWRGEISWWWLAAPAVAFLGLARRHDRVISERDLTARAIRFYERGEDRLADRWSHAGETGDRFADPAHPFAADLDLFGSGSLFQLLSIARTRIGESVLASWLMSPAPADAVRARQAAVEELTPLLDLREAVALAGADIRAGVEADALMTWAEHPPRLRHTWLRPVALVLACGAVAATVVWATRGDVTWLLVVVALEVVAFATQQRQMHEILHSAGGWSRDLDLLAQVLDRLERASFASPRLAAIRGRLDASGLPPATAIRRLHRLVEMHDWQHNLIFSVIAIPLLWDVHIAFAMEAWRARHGGRVRTWLEVVGEFEALSSLATYRFEHPGDPFPTLDTERAEGGIDGAGLGHPLLPAARTVRNDVRLDATSRLLVVSGSNMSGKSTLLRTIGINVVLAFAGAPVRATALRLTPLRLGATLRIQDSLQEGRSRFYAEITRVRELADLALTGPPLLFLLDELFSGTNSHDRLIGASGVLRSFLDRGAIGLVTTHDLALTAVASELAPRAMNVHFDDHFENGELVFDYRMKPGPVTRSNALALMRAVGLNVDGD